MRSIENDGEEEALPVDGAPGHATGTFASSGLDELLAGIDEMLRHGFYGKRTSPKPGEKVLRPFDTLDDK